MRELPNTADQLYANLSHENGTINDCKFELEANGVP